VKTIDSSPYFIELIILVASPGESTDWIPIAGPNV
jgi:hypothetical protein